jgi:hypothetical protein
MLFVCQRNKIKMSSQNTISETQNSTSSNNTANSITYYNCAAGTYCQLPLVNNANSPQLL